MSVVVVALMYSSLSAFHTSTFYVFAAPPHPNFISSTDCDTGPPHEGEILRCCWTEVDPNDPEGIELRYCLTCDGAGNCTDVYPDQRTSKQPLSSLTLNVAGDAAPPPPPGPKVPRGNILPNGGVLQEFEPTPQSPPLLQQPGKFAPEVALPTAEDGTGQSPTETLCIKGFEVNEETGLCVPIQETQDTEERQVEEQDELEQEEQEQPTEEGDEN